MRAISWTAGLLVLACGGSGPHEGAPDSGPPRGPDVPAPICAPVSGAPDQRNVDCGDVARIGLVDAAPRLGSGVELVVRLEGADGGTLDAARYGACIHPMTTDCSALDVAPLSEARPAEGALTAVLVAPGRSADGSARAQAVVDAFLSARPAGERVAIFRWGADVRQVANFSTDRRVTRRLAARGLAPADEQPMAPGEAMAAVAHDLEKVAHGAFLGVRTIVVVAPEPPAGLDALPAAPPAVASIWGLPAAAGAGPGVVTLDEDAATAAADLSAALDAHTDAGLVRLAWCGPQSEAEGEEQEDVLIKAFDSQAELAVQMPARLAEEGHMQCSSSALAAPRSYPERIEFVFTSEGQRDVYRDRVEDDSKDEFEVSLRLWDSGALVPARAHLRGQSSLFYCERKSFDVDILGSEPRRFMPGSASDELFLIAMCDDDFYINQVTADRLSARVGAFPLQIRLIELMIDGEHAGVYLLIEKPQDEMRLDNSRVRGIVRREEDFYGEPPEPKYGHENEEQALVDYESFLTSVQEGLPIEALEMRMDLDQYLRWVALMTLLGNGDYIDEVYFVATETVDASLAPTDFYTIAGWDPDDLFSPCHHDGRYAVEDPNGMIYCAEGLLDHAMFLDEEIYARYVSVLSSVLDEVSQERFGETLDETVGELDGYFRNEDIRRAMIELHEDDPDEAPSYEDVMDDIREAAEEMKDLFAERHEELRQAVQDWQEDEQ